MLYTKFYYMTSTLHLNMYNVHKDKLINMTWVIALVWWFFGLKHSRWPKSAMETSFYENTLEETLSQLWWRTRQPQYWPVGGSVSALIQPTLKGVKRLLNTVNFVLDSQNAAWNNREVGYMRNPQHPSFSILWMISCLHLFPLPHPKFLLIYVAVLWKTKPPCKASLPGSSI